jgi:hypothetical protein
VIVVVSKLLVAVGVEDIVSDSMESNEATSTDRMARKWHESKTTHVIGD